MTTSGPQLPPRVRITCHVCGRITRTRQPEGTRLPCVPCSQDAGRTTMLTVPAVAVPDPRTYERARER